MKLGGRKGRIVPGMDADLIILKENPLSDIRNIATVGKVVCAGTVYTQDFLADELQRVHQLKTVEKLEFGTDCM